MKKVVQTVIRIASLFSVFILNTSFIDLRWDTFEFQGYFGNEKLVQGRNYFCASQNDSVSVEVCRFYISDVVLYQGSRPVGAYDYKLVDLFDSASRSFKISFYSDGDVSEIRFKLGIDSTTNVAGVGKGELDPTKGMYWTWQSGYINLKLEGKSKICKANRGAYQYHIGGYAAPNNSLREVVLKLDQDHGDFHVKVDVEQFFSKVDMKETTHVMSPSAKSQELADHAAQMFSPIK